MGRSSAALAWTLVAVVQIGFGIALAQAPAAAEERPFFREHPVLRFLEQRLPPGATAVVPPVPEEGKHVATDLELRDAFAGVLTEFLAPPATFASKAGELINEVCRYRPAQTPQWIAVAADVILKQALPSAAKDLDDAVDAAVAANPAAASEVVRATLRRLATGMQAGEFRSGARFDRAAAVRAAGRSVSTGIGLLKTAPQIRDLVAQSLEETFAQSAHDLVIETLAAAASDPSRLEGAQVHDLARLALIQHGKTSKLNAAIICVGLLKGAGPDAATTIKDEAALNLPVPFSAYANIVCSAYVAVAPAPAAAALNISRFITVTNADYIPAAVLGAIVAAPAKAGDLLQAGLNRDLVLRGRATTRDIVEAAMVVGERSAPELAVAAVGHGDLQEGNAATMIAEGIVRGLPVSRLGAALVAQMGAQEKSSATIKATVAGAMAGALSTEKPRAVAVIAAAAARDSPFAADVLDQVIISAPGARQYAGVCGVLAACPGQAGALLERARQHADLAAGQAAPIAAGGSVILAVQRDPAGFYQVATQWLRGADETVPGLVDAIVLAAALANPRGAPAVAASAAICTQTPAERLVAITTQADPGAASRVLQAVEMAIEMKNDSGNLFRTVQARITANPEFAPEIVTGAIAAAPHLGFVAGHAAVLAAPTAIRQIVPRLFAFSPQNEFAETSVDLTRGLLRGLLDADLEPVAENDAVTDAVAASIQSVVALSRRRAVGVPAIPERETITAVITAAVQTAPGHAVEIAQIAARTTRTLACPTADRGTIKDAVLAAAPQADSAKIADAISAGVAEADLQVPAVEVKALFDYAHDSLTGVPMTSFRDL